MIRAENIYFKYKDFVLEDLSFEIKRGEFVAILGPNGAGKSTLLKIIAGILKPFKGKIVVETEKIAYLPQKERINLDLPIKIKEIFEFTAKVLMKDDYKKYVEIAEVAEDKLFRELSGGMQQKVLIARLLMLDPDLILLDEPFNGIDLRTQEKIASLLKKLSLDGKTVVTVVHNINPILHEVDRVMLLNKKIIAFGKTEEVFREENILKAYGAKIPLAVCEEGFRHPLYA